MSSREIKYLIGLPSRETLAVLAVSMVLTERQIGRGDSLLKISIRNGKIIGLYSNNIFHKRVNCG